jgi:histidyl-tRNA synthetase
MKNLIQPVKGTRDFYPEEMQLRNWLFSMIEDVSCAFGYQEYDGPFLEKVDLYASKSGEELVNDQSFVFPDRGGELLTLRPELTPTLARMVAQKQRELVFPLRWWSIGPFWRYERPQKGRTREFFQWNIDLIGVNSPEADAELVAVAASFFKRLRLRPDQVGILVNNRRLMDQELSKVGVSSELKQAVFRLIDRRDKMRPEEWEAYAIENGVSQEQLIRIKELLGDKQLWQRSDELVRFFTTLDSLGVAEYVKYDPEIIRGLDYYTGTVFEARDFDGGRAILGGGRYDNLVGAVGGDPLPGIGFAMGDVMISIVLKKYQLVPEVSINTSPILVTVFDETLLQESYRLSNQLRASGLRVSVYPESVKLPKQLRYADRMGFQLVLIVGPEEMAAGTIVIKDLTRRNQVTSSRAEMIATIQNLLAREGRV